MKIIHFIFGYVRFISIIFIPVYVLISLFYAFDVSTTTGWTMDKFIEINHILNTDRPIPIMLLWIILFMISDKIERKTKPLREQEIYEDSQA